MWYKKWFNEDYLHLYAHRSLEEAVVQVEFIEKFLLLDGRERVLDLACGTGRHSLAFALKGYQVLGIDLSETLIEKAKERITDVHVPVSFHVADIFDLPDIGKFDLVTNLFTSFGYFDEDSRNTEVFAIVNRHLKKGGKFFLDFLHPYSVQENLVPEEKLTIQGESVSIRRKIENGFVFKEIRFPNRSYMEKVKLYRKETIVSMIEQSGLIVHDIWNDYEGNAWQEKGDRQLFFCKKKGG